MGGCHAASLGKNWYCAINPELTRGDWDNLRHMLGATTPDRRHWGKRNVFAPVGKDIASMHRLEKAGLVKRGKSYQGTTYFHATLTACQALGMGRVSTKRALQGRLDEN
jgi:hypothetical protein